MSLWLLPSRRNPGKHLSSLNGTHDRLCAKALEDGMPLNLVLYKWKRFREMQEKAGGAGGNRTHV